MPLLESAIKIDAPIERVFNAVIDPTSIAKFAPVHSVSDIKGNIGEKGNSADYEYHVMGIKLKQTMTVLEVDEPFTVIYEMSGAFPGKWMYTLESHEGGTVVRVKVDYSTGTGMISKIANLLFVNETNEKNLEIGQLGLKRFCEY